MDPTKKEHLFDVADRQKGYFTAKQAKESGYFDANFPHLVRTGEWVKEGRGIYRLRYYPLAERPELAYWSLWSANKQGVVQGIWSHQTALDIYELSDVMPSKMHMTVPSHFRRSTPTPGVLVLHRSDLTDTDIKQMDGFMVTTPLRTLVDVIMSNSVLDNLLAQAIRQSFERGLITRNQLMTIRDIFPLAHQTIMRIWHEISTL